MIVYHCTHCAATVERRRPIIGLEPCSRCCGFGFVGDESVRSLVKRPRGYLRRAGQMAPSTSKEAL